MARLRLAYLGIKGIPSKSGAERVVEAIATRLAARHEVTIYCNQRYTPRGTRVPHIRLVRVPAFRGKHLESLSTLLYGVLHALLLGRYDLVHLHNTESALALPLLRLRYPVITTSHGQPYVREKWSPPAKRLMRVTDWLYAWCSSAITTVSQPLHTLYLRRFRRTVYYIPNGVAADAPLDDCAAAATLARNGVVDQYILFAAGRVDPTKGCHLVLDAFRRVHTDLQLVVVGNLTTLPAYGERLRRMADARVRFIPFIAGRAELFSIVRGARLFLFPSTVEAMSMMLLEAAALRVPIVCSDIPENVAVLGPYACYFPSGDTEALARTIESALGHRLDTQAMAEAAAKHVRASFSWDDIARRYERLYEMTMGTREL